MLQSVYMFVYVYMYVIYINLVELTDFVTPSFLENVTKRIAHW